MAAAPISIVDLKNDAMSTTMQTMKDRIEGLEMEIGGPTLKPAMMLDLGNGSPRLSSTDSPRMSSSSNRKNKSNPSSPKGGSRSASRGSRNSGGSVQSKKKSTTRPLLSLVRSLDTMMSKLQGREQLRGFQLLVAKLDDLSFLIDRNGLSLNGIASEFRVRRKAVIESREMAEDTKNLLIELDYLKNDMKSKELVVDMSELNQRLLAAEATMNQRIKQALAIQIAIDEVMETYNAIVSAATQQQLHYHSMLLHAARDKSNRASS
mmetsp:Transcript_17531/g.34063  ORF Transcript_17531/g.34063 Transcript_17531/m.34063 type:complete len:264 (+) Transcript_17531:2-793(+)